MNIGLIPAVLAIGAALTLFAGIFQAIASWHTTSPEVRRRLLPFALICIIFAIVFAYASYSTSLSQPQTPSVAFYPHLAPAYQGTVYSTTSNHQALLKLTSIAQNQQAISGTLIIGPDSVLCGSGTFAGTIDSNGYMNFTISPSPTDKCANNPITVSGSLQTDGSLSGTYVIPNLNEQGTWQARPS